MATYPIERLPHDMIVCDCAGCLRVTASRRNPKDIDRANFRGMPILGGRVDDRPMCDWCYAHAITFGASENLRAILGDPRNGRAYECVPAQ